MPQQQKLQYLDSVETENRIGNQILLRQINRAQ